MQAKAVIAELHLSLTDLLSARAEHGHDLHLRDALRPGLLTSGVCSGHAARAVARRPALSTYSISVTSDDVAAPAAMPPLWTLPMPRRALSTTMKQRKLSLTGALEYTPVVASRASGPSAARRWRRRRRSGGEVGARGRLLARVHDDVAGPGRSGKSRGPDRPREPRMPRGLGARSLRRVDAVRTLLGVTALMLRYASRRSSRQLERRVRRSAERDEHRDRRYDVRVPAPHSLHAASSPTTLVRSCSPPSSSAPVCHAAVARPRACGAISGLPR